jgi:hypothetical protein
MSVCRPSAERAPLDPVEPLRGVSGRVPDLQRRHPDGHHGFGAVRRQGAAAVGHRAAVRHPARAIRRLRRRRRAGSAGRVLRSQACGARLARRLALLVCPARGLRSPSLGAARRAESGTARSCPSSASSSRRASGGAVLAGGSIQRPTRSRHRGAGVARQARTRLWRVRRPRTVIRVITEVTGAGHRYRRGESI